MVTLVGTRLISAGSHRSIQSTSGYATTLSLQKCRQINTFTLDAGVVDMIRHFAHFRLSATSFRMVRKNEHYWIQPGARVSQVGRTRGCEVLSSVVYGAGPVADETPRFGGRL
uniref:Uncharacterized protein n=1 Tax=Hyaloperonospora arabidopsidis (strain Emoy2) TaxID=559515 RepID=M4C3Z2_HYAAE